MSACVQVLLKLLAYLFARLPVHPALVRRHGAAGAVVATRTHHLAPDHLAVFEPVMTDYNSRCRELFIAHLRQSIAKQAVDSPAPAAAAPAGAGGPVAAPAPAPVASPFALPLSKVPFGAGGDAAGESWGWGGGEGCLDFGW